MMEIRLMETVAIPIAQLKKDGLVRLRPQALMNVSLLAAITTGSRIQLLNNASHGLAKIQVALIANFNLDTHGILFNSKPSLLLFVAMEL